MRAIIHLASIAVIAALSGCIGLWYLSDGRASHSEMFEVMGVVMGASCAIWVPLGLLYRYIETAWLIAIYFGILSPFIGCILLMPPWSFLIVFSKPSFSIGLGLLTSFLVCAVSQYFALDYE